MSFTSQTLYKGVVSALSVESRVGENLTQKMHEERKANYDEEKEDGTISGYSNAYRFLDNGLNSEGFENWVIELLSLTGKDRKDSEGAGVEKGRVHLENPFICKSTWRGYDFDLGSENEGASRALSEHYRQDTLKDDFSIGWSEEQIGDVFKILSMGLPDETVKREDRSNGTNQYEFQMNKEDFRLVYEVLETEVFPTSKIVEDELEKHINDISIDEYMENFPYAHTDHIMTQLGIRDNTIHTAREEYFTNL